MKVKFLRDYHGPETNEYRYLEGAEVVLSDEVAKNFIDRKIVVSVEPATGGFIEIPVAPIGSEYGYEVYAPVVEQAEPEIEVVKPVKIVTKRKPKKK